MSKQQHYFELRKQAARGTDSIAADIMRHFHARQHIGKAVVVCSQPVGLMAACRRQWLKMGRMIQRQRASTLNADKILKYTHVITRMQHIRFSSKQPLNDPEAAIYFLTDEACVDAILPPQCLSVYLTIDLSPATIETVSTRLPADALVVDYLHANNWEGLGLAPKTVLEDRAAYAWDEVVAFLASQDIDLDDLITDNMQNVDAMDEALDTLLGVSHRFLSVANNFHHALGLARPLRTDQALRRQHDSLMLLAYRVQALSPGAFTHHFLETYNEDDTFFLYDRREQQFTENGESLFEAVVRQEAAGRQRLARALHSLFGKL
jgi:hypothetical protein